LTAEILGEREIEAFIRSWELLPASGGKFEVKINGELVFSKKELKRHAEAGEIRLLVVEKLALLRGSSCG
jgi:selenoprotein W-related protein